MKWTERQAQAIEERNTNLLVSAAAGSGKTAVLVERVKRLILEEQIGIDEILVLTFTNAAASEMKEKILKSINDELSSCEGNQEKQRFLRRQLLLIPRANISTFHAFALEIVHRYYHIIDIAPALSICDVSKQKILKDEAMQELLEDCFEQGSEEFRTFLDDYCSSRDNETLKDMIFDFHSFMQSLPDADEWFQSAMQSLTASDIPLENKPILVYLARRIDDGLNMTISYFNKAIDLLTDIKDADGRPVLMRLAQKMKEDVSAVESIKEVLVSGKFETAVAAIRAGIAFSRISADKSEKPYYEENLKEDVTEYRDAGKRRFKKILQWCTFGDFPAVQDEFAMIGSVAATFYRLACDFDHRYAQKKEAQKVLDFSDIEHFALRILEDAEVCMEYRENFRYIFIDEYQDSNMVQENLILRICRSDNLFMVGDVKQSIYKFRLAEPELFINKYSSFKSGDSVTSKVIDLNSNFRSKNGVIDFVNELFGTIMNKKSTGLDYDCDAALVKGCSYQGPCDFKTELYLVDANPDAEEDFDEEIAELKAVELEALQAVSIIKQNLGQTIYDDQKNQERPLAYRDMVILLRAARGNGEIFYQALADADIPVFLDRNEGYFDTIEIQVFLNLLRIIDNKKQDIPLLSVLRSPVFGFCADELASIRIFANQQSSGRVPYNEAFEIYSKQGDQELLKEKCSAFLNRLILWRKQATFVPLGDFLWELLVSTGYHDFSGAISGGDQRQANLKALVDKATEYEMRNAKGLFGFINYIEALAGRNGKIDIGQAKILSEGANAVRIMTIHKSKGLEFPFVLLAGMGKKLNSHFNRLPVAYHKELGFGFRLSNSKKSLHYDSIALQMINDKAKQEDLAESIRILYVALTRPKDRLLLLGAAKDPMRALDKAYKILPGDVESAATYMEMIVSAMRDSLQINVIGREQLEKNKNRRSVDKTELQQTLEEGFAVDERECELSKAELIKRLSFSYPDQENVKYKTKYTVSQIAALERNKHTDLPKVLSAIYNEEEMQKDYNAEEFLYSAPKFLFEEKAPDAAERGTAYHIVMEHIPFTKEGKTSGDIAKFIEKLTEANVLSPSQAAFVNVDNIASFFASQTGRRMMESIEIFKEAPFVMKSVYNGSEVLVQGTIDCYFKEGDSLVLVDYKSNYIDKSKKAEEIKRMERIYLPQMRLYKEALEGISGLRVKESIIYLFGIDDQLSLKY